MGFGWCRLELRLCDCAELGFGLVLWIDARAIGVSSGDSGWQTRTATTDGTFNPLNFHGEFTRDEAMGKGIDRHS
jgi:hypothetical protein